MSYTTALFAGSLTFLLMEQLLLYSVVEEANEESSNTAGGNIFCGITDACCMTAAHKCQKHLYFVTVKVSGLSTQVALKSFS